MLSYQRNTPVRTTIDLPEGLFRRAKATAAMRGVSMKSLMIAALERETEPEAPPKSSRQKPFPTIHLKHMKKLDLTGFNFDDLLP
jgi:hypothetical protein